MDPAGASPRKCGTCTLCCKVLGIVALSKPANVWCPHCAPRQGCKIYPDRPAECRTFSCGWLIDTSVPDEWRPDKSKLVIFPDEDPQRILVHVDPGSPEAWRREPYYSVLRRFAAQRLQAGGTVLVVVKGKTTMILPDGEVFLGVVEDGDKVVLNHIQDPGGVRLEAKVIKSFSAAGGATAVSAERRRAE